MSSAIEEFRGWQGASPVPRDGRCRSIDDEGCRCLAREGHRGPHDYSYTPWLTTLAGVEGPRKSEWVVWGAWGGQ